MAVSSIGSDVGRDFATIRDWINSFPATLAENMVGEMYNDSEFVTEDNTEFIGYDSNGFTVTLRPADGEGIATTKGHVRYDPANGVAIRRTVTQGSAIKISVAGVAIQGIQIKTDSDNSYSLDDLGGSTVDGCIIETAEVGTAGGCVRVASGAGTYTNNIFSLIKSGPSCFFISFTEPSIINNTFYASTTESQPCIIDSFTGSTQSPIIANNAFINFTTPTQTYNTNALSVGNATDAATIGVGGTVLVDMAAQFNSVNYATLDLRVKSDSLLAELGADNGLVPSTDIFNAPRDALSPTVGAYEIATIPTTGSMQYNGQPISDVKYSDSNGVYHDVQCMVNGVIVWGD